MIKGAGTERSAERPVATLAQVWALADAVDARFRALVLTAAFAGLRFGELAALTRTRVDLDSSHDRGHRNARRGPGRAAPRPAEVRRRPAHGRDSCVAGP